MWIIRVGYQGDVADPLGKAVKQDIKDLGFKVEDVKVLPTYMIEGEVERRSLDRLCTELLTDPITQYYTHKIDAKGFDWMVEVKLKKGVTDTVGESVKLGCSILGVKGVKSVSTAVTYLLKGNISKEELSYICIKVLSNPIIQNYSYKRI